MAAALGRHCGGQRFPRTRLPESSPGRSRRWRPRVATDPLRRDSSTVVGMLIIRSLPGWRDRTRKHLTALVEEPPAGMLDGMDRSLTWRASKVIEAPLVDVSTICAPQHRPPGMVSDGTRSFRRARSVLVSSIYRSCRRHRSAPSSHSGRSCLERGASQRQLRRLLDVAGLG
jgi:hypothetical protein